MKFFASLVFVLALTLTVPLRAEDATPPPADPKEKATASPEEKKSGADAAFDLPVPVGEPVKGLRVPQYDEEGNLQFMFDAETARKIDEKTIELEVLKIDAHADDGKKFYVELPRAVFNLETRVLNGQERVLIRREDFEIHGEESEFHVKTRFAKILGNVKMIIHSTESFDQP